MLPFGLVGKSQISLFHTFTMAFAILPINQPFWPVLLYIIYTLVIFTCVWF
ncbi:hypothetical protein JHK87_014778 [Glycine soja]|nr:hypothetical protein JHK87_014778 [Glycine soja]